MTTISDIIQHSKFSRRITNSFNLISFNMLPAALKWCPTSEEELELVETELLSGKFAKNHHQLN